VGQGGSAEAGIDDRLDPSFAEPFAEVPRCLGRPVGVRYQDCGAAEVAKLQVMGPCGVRVGGQHLHLRGFEPLTLSMPSQVRGSRERMGLAGEGGQGGGDFLECGADVGGGGAGFVAAVGVSGVGAGGNCQVK
jgi:hypothetical protein